MHQQLIIEKISGVLGAFLFRVKQKKN